MRDVKGLCPSNQKGTSPAPTYFHDVYQSSTFSRPSCSKHEQSFLFPTGHLDVSMAATNLENQLHSAQKNLLFLQREHASTLKGLHAEIRRLQQHCTGGSKLLAAGQSHCQELGLLLHWAHSPRD